MNDSRVIHAHLRAAKKLLAASMDQLKATDPEAYTGALAVLRAGAVARITTALSVAGLMEVDVSLVDGQGTAAHVASVAFDAPPTRH